MAGTQGKVRLKCVMVGDSKVGKSSLLLTHFCGDYPEEYIPTVMETFTGSKWVEGREYELEMWETAAPPEYNGLRPLCYPHTDVFLLMYSVIDEASLNNITNRWIPEIQQHVAVPNFLLGASKSDMATQSEAYIPSRRGQALAEKFNMSAFVEFSAKGRDGLDILFDKLFDAAIQHYTDTHPEKKNSKCTIS